MIKSLTHPNVLTDNSMITSILPDQDLNCETDLANCNKLKTNVSF